MRRSPTGWDETMHNAEWVLFFWVLANQAGVPFPGGPVAAGRRRTGEPQRPELRPGPRHRGRRRALRGPRVVRLGPMAWRPGGVGPLPTPSSAAGLDRSGRACLSHASAPVHVECAVPPRAESCRGGAGWRDARAADPLLPARGRKRAGLDGGVDRSRIPAGWRDGRDSRAIRHPSHGPDRARPRGRGGERAHLHGTASPGMPAPGRRRRHDDVPFPACAARARRAGRSDIRWASSWPAGWRGCARSCSR